MGLFKKVVSSVANTAKAVVTAPKTAVESVGKAVVDVAKGGNVLNSVANAATSVGTSVVAANPTSMGSASTFEIIPESGRNIANKATLGLSGRYGNVLDFSRSVAGGSSFTDDERNQAVVDAAIVGGAALAAGGALAGLKAPAVLSEIKGTVGAATGAVGGLGGLSFLGKKSGGDSEDPLERAPASVAGAQQGVRSSFIVPVAILGVGALVTFSLIRRG